MIVTDLDRTLIFSAGAARTTTDELVCVEHLDGAPLSFMTARAARLLGELSAATAVVPTTTRTVAQYSRIALPGGPYRYAVTTNGGTILVDGVPDAAWRARIDAEVRATSAPLAEITAEMARRSDPSWVLKSRTADDLFCYLVVDLRTLPEEFCEEWSLWCAEKGWGVSQQGRKIYTMPTNVCKSTAAAEVRMRLERDGVVRPTDTLLAAGDGALDAPLLTMADEAIRPAHGELHELGWTTPGMVVTATSGAAAGESIVQWMIARAFGTDHRPSNIGPCS